VAWSTGTNTSGYASPVLFAAGAKTQVLVFAAKQLVGLDPSTGRALWRFPFETKWDTNITDPLVQGSHVFISSFSRGSAWLSVGGDQPELVYQTTNPYNHLSPGLVVGGYHYAFNGEAKFTTDFRCLQLATGQVKWSRKDPAFGTLIGAGDKLILLSEKGELKIATASPDAFKPLARAQVIEGTCWTPPALADGRLYVRNAKGTLACLDLRSRR
jgi:outer membrane protein assembly factor BamB